MVFANRAAESQESRQFGSTGLHYKERWQVSKGDLGPKGYSATESSYVYSAVFRKRTDAIHVATLIPLFYNQQGSGNPRFPLEDVHSYLVENTCSPPACSCLPGRDNDAGTYVECGCLPCVLRWHFDLRFARKRRDKSMERISLMRSRKTYKETMKP